MSVYLRLSQGLVAQGLVANNNRGLGACQGLVV